MTHPRGAQSLKRNKFQKEPLGGMLCCSSPFSSLSETTRAVVTLPQMASTVGCVCERKDTYMPCCGSSPTYWPCPLWLQYCSAGMIRRSCFALTKNVSHEPSLEKIPFCPVRKGCVQYSFCALQVFCTCSNAQLLTLTGQNSVSTLSKLHRVLFYYWSMVIP